MSRTITIIGATGQQGGSVARILLAAGNWNVRAVTRNAEGNAAKALAENGAEIVVADIGDETSLAQAFEGSYAVFSTGNFWEPISQGKSLDEAGALEEAQGIIQARVAARTPSLKHFIWSTLPHSSNLTEGRIPVAHWDYKANVDTYIQKKLPELAAKTTFLYFGMYSDTLMTQPFLSPVEIPGSSGRYAFLAPTKADAYVSLTGDMSVNPGIWVRQILANPEKSRGKYAAVFAEIKTFQEMLEDWSAATGKVGIFVEISSHDYERIWGLTGRDLAAQLKFGEEFADWTAHVKNDFVDRNALGIKPEEIIGTKEAMLNRLRKTT